jgi:HSP20 family protein
MAIQRWDPLGDLVRLRDRMNELFEETLSRSGPADDKGSVEPTGWRPAVDLFEEPDRYLLRADLPGVAATDVDVQVEDGHLVLRGERRMDAAVQRESYLRVERPYGRFRTRIALPSSVDRDRIQARHRNGVLEVALPKKKEERGPGRIEVASG